MPLIQIELEDLDKIRSASIEAWKQHDSLRKEYDEFRKAVDKESLRKNAIALSRKMFRDVMCAVFTKLGLKAHINPGFYESITFDYDQIERFIGGEWMYSELLKVEFGITLTNEIAEAFIKVGVDQQKLHQRYEKEDQAKTNLESL